MEIIIKCLQDKKDNCQREVVIGCDGCKSAERLMHCNIKDKLCKHAYYDQLEHVKYCPYNPELGHDVCGGEYCDTEKPDKNCSWCANVEIKSELPETTQCTLLTKFFMQTIEKKGKDYVKDHLYSLMAEKARTCKCYEETRKDKL